MYNFAIRRLTPSHFILPRPDIRRNCSRQFETETTTEKNFMRLKANVLAVKAAPPGRHSIDAKECVGLYLHVTETKAGISRRLLLRYHRDDGSPNELSLGMWPTDIELKDAIDEAQRLRREMKQNGVETALRTRRATRTPAIATDEPTVREALKMYVEAFADTGGAAARARLIEQYAEDLLPLAVAGVAVDDVRKAVEPTMKRIPKTGKRLLNALSLLFSFAKARELRKVDDPASRDVWKHLAPSPPPVVHHRALDYRDCPKLFQRLMVMGSTVPLALAYLMLCGSRTNEVLAAKWSDTSLDERLWTIPGERMKNRKPHVVPLTPPALAILELMRARRRHSDHLFPAGHGGKLSNRRLESLCHRELKLACSVHGFRSSLRDWLGNETDVPRETCEEILSHTLGGVEGAYRRSSSTAKKRAALELWAAYLANPA
jgi:integrase